MEIGSSRKWAGVIPAQVWCAIGNDAAGFCGSLQSFLTKINRSRSSMYDSDQRQRGNRAEYKDMHEPLSKECHVTPQMLEGGLCAANSRYGQVTPRQGGTRKAR